jgi:hypothetical protein
MDFLASRAEDAEALEDLNVDTILEEVQSLPSFRDEEFKDAYPAAYAKITKDIWKKRSPYDAELAKQILSWLVLNRDPLNFNIDMMKRALLLQKNKDKPESDPITASKIKSICRGFVIVDSHSGNVRVVHSTAQD